MIPKIKATKYTNKRLLNISHDLTLILDMFNSYYYSISVTTFYPFYLDLIMFFKALFQFPKERNKARR